MIILPSNAVKYIKAQRDSLQRAKLATDKHHIKEWNRSCMDEFNWLLENVKIEGNLLDIGCGLGGVDVLLAPCVDHLYLLDGTGWDDWRVGYRKETKPWNSLDVTRDVMALNGLSDKTTLIDYKDRPDIQVDTVISNVSWCYHYPVDEYLDWVSKILTRGGHLCVDWRFHDDFFSEINKIHAAGFMAAGAEQLIKWGDRWKGMRVVYIKT
jgi:SAM-dependent methyltransferase